MRALASTALISLAVISATWVAPAGAAHAAPEPNKLHIAFGGGGAATDWKNDANGFSSLYLGYKIGDFVAPYFLGRLGYGTVDTRVLTFISFGAQFWHDLGPLAPYARVGLFHEHEENVSAVRADPVGALFGVGDGIRHRHGSELGLGLDLPLITEARAEIFARVEVSTIRFFDARGPLWTWAGSFAFGLDYDL